MVLFFTLSISSAYAICMVSLDCYCGRNIYWHFKFACWHIYRYTGIHYTVYPVSKFIYIPWELPSLSPASRFCSWMIRILSLLSWTELSACAAVYPSVTNFHSLLPPCFILRVHDVRHATITPVCMALHKVPVDTRRQELHATYHQIDSMRLRSEAYMWSEADTWHQTLYSLASPSICYSF